MPPQDLGASHETPRDTVEIVDDAAISIQHAIAIAQTNAVTIGKSTLQRWAKHWAELGTAAPVKSVLVTNRDGKFYRLDRNDFEAWILEQGPNIQSPETPQDPARSYETSQDPKRPYEVSRDPMRPPKTSPQENADVAELRDENMQLRIDLEVRKQLLSKAVEQSQQQSEKIEMLLRENGALGFQLLQLQGPTMSKNERSATSSPAGEGEPQFGKLPHIVPVENVNNRTEPAS